MRFIAWNMAVSGWLLFSSLALLHSPVSAALSGLLAVLIGSFALASPGVPGLRFANAILAIVLAWAALLMPEAGALARVNNAIVAAAVFALSLIPGRSTTSAAPPDP
jgi:hypothetical protein